VSGKVHAETAEVEGRAFLFLCHFLFSFFRGWSGLDRRRRRLMQETGSAVNSQLVITRFES